MNEEEATRCLACLNLLEAVFRIARDELGRFFLELRLENNPLQSLSLHHSFLAQHSEKLQSVVIVSRPRFDIPAVNDLYAEADRLIEMLISDVADPLALICELPEATESQQAEKSRRFFEFKDEKPWEAVFRFCLEMVPTFKVRIKEAAADLRRLVLPPVIPRRPCRAFVISTSVSESYGRALIDPLNARLDGFEAIFWKDAKEFENGTAIFEGLEQVVANYDFGIAVIGPEDSYIPSTDGRISLLNVILEYGMFAGRGGRSRAFIVQPQGFEIGISDLGGIIKTKYSAKKDSGFFSRFIFWRSSDQESQDIDGFVNLVAERLATGIRKQCAQADK